MKCFKWLRNGVMIGIVAMVVWVNLFVVRLVIVHGPSMEDTLSDGQFVLMWQWNYRVQPGDIVVTDNHNPLAEHLIKRVVAVGGDTLQIDAGGYIWRNDRKSEALRYQGIEELQMTIPPGYVFLLGDNHAFSKDSRHIGCIPEAEVMGKVLFY